MGPEVCSGDQQADASVPEDERRLLPHWWEVRQGGYAMEILVPRAG